MTVPDNATALGEHSGSAGTYLVVPEETGHDNCALFVLDPGCDPYAAAALAAYARACRHDNPDLADRVDRAHLTAVGGADPACGNYAVHQAHRFLNIDISGEWERHCAGVTRTRH